MPESSASERFAMIDIARFYGIVLVYYGHVVERMMYLGNGPAAAQYKFIYSFHMPLFFILAGFIARDFSAEQSPGRFALNRLTGRVVPLLFFSALLALLSLLHGPDFPPIPLDTAADYGNALKSSLLNLPVFNIPTWFLMCLVSVELIHYLVFRHMRVSNWRIAVAAILFYVVGFVVNERFELTRLGDPWRWNWWFFNEAVVMYAFYLLGVLLRRQRFLLAEKINMPALAVLALVAVLGVFLTYDLNQGPFSLGIPAVVIVGSSHGHMLWFPLTAIAGSLAILFLGRLSTGIGWMALPGRNALILFCLNGFFYHHLNGPFASWFGASLPQGGAPVTAAAIAATAASVLIAWPVLVALRHWFPQLTGRPGVDGPLLPRLLR